MYANISFGLLYGESFTFFQMEGGKKQSRRDLLLISFEAFTDIFVGREEFSFSLYIERLRSFFSQFMCSWILTLALLVVSDVALTLQTLVCSVVFDICLWHCACLLQ